MRPTRTKTIPYIIYAQLLRPQPYAWRKDSSPIESEISIGLLAKQLKISTGRTDSYIEFLDMLGLITITSTRGKRPRYVTIRINLRAIRGINPPLMEVVANEP